MAAATESNEHLTAYERAVCYYTLPRVTSPLTGGIVIAYAVVLLEALALLVYGVAKEEEVYTKWGAILSVATIVFGIVSFFVRAFLNAVHEQKTLAEAKRVPDADEASGLPDPFEGHLLLRCRRLHGAKNFDIEDNDGNLQYRVAVGRHDKHFELSKADGDSALEVEAFTGRDSFVFDFSRHPGRVLVHRGDTELAHVRRRYTFMDPSSDIFVHRPEEIHYVTRRGAIFRNDRLVGRIYTVRQFAYLDIEEQNFHDGILGYFVAMV